jgi:cobyrinic acid a,c-diamide synthase
LDKVDGGEGGLSVNRSRLVIAGTHSGVGKTTLTLGIMAALRRRGLVVQGFKAGPDYIDPSYHTAVTGRPSRNLDSWMTGPDAVREIFLRASTDADISVIEGVMGLYDGRDAASNTGSTAEIATLLKAPVILVVDAASMARSAAAVVLGFQRLDPEVRLAGVIVNRIGGESHLRLVRTAIEQVCGIPVLGGLAREEGIEIPERHLGLIPALERGELAPLFERLADIAERSVDLNRLVEIARSAPAAPQPGRWLFERTTNRGGGPSGQPRATIAVARDSAFHFYYPENLELLEQFGARLVEFRPLEGELVPDDADGLYIGGGFPEEYAERLAAQSAVREDVRRRIEAGLPTFAECGGFMFLTKSITDRAGNTYPMVGVIPAEVRMQDRLAALGYREVRALCDSFLMAGGEYARGHEFHYSTVTFREDAVPYAYEVAGLRGTRPEGYVRGSLVAGYTHLHFASNPDLARRFVDACAAYRSGR